MYILQLNVCAEKPRLTLALAQQFVVIKFLQYNDMTGMLLLTWSAHLTEQKEYLQERDAKGYRPRNVFVLRQEIERKASWDTTEQHWSKHVVSKHVVSKHA